ncbi:MAG: NACHT domain-containing protein, partial [Leptolyngbya sp. SIO1D8]|nr:NACHT domain-containing protein [Leptolyngbya sp. SIO1D8]
MLEWLAAATGAQLGKLVLEQILNLSKPVLESYVQDFFRGCLDSGVARLQAPTLKAPMAEAIGFFIQRFVKELQFNDVPDTSIDHHYKPVLKRFVRDKTVCSILGKAFETGCKRIDFAQMEQIWVTRYPETGWQFPTEEFDWRGVAKEYVVQVKGIIKADPALSALLETDLLEAIAHNTAQISPGFDIATYRESLQASYGYLKLYTLDSTDRTDAVKLWNMFIEQTVREALPPMRYELPLDLKRQLQAEGQLDEDLSPEALEHYRHEYFQQPARKVLDAIRDSQQAIILGDPGAGKSTLLQYLALDWVEGKTETLPLLVELREYALAQSTNFLEFLHSGRGADWQFDQQQLHRHLLENPTLVMFDGLDEVFDRATQSAVIDDIIRFAQQYPQARVLVTSRIIGYNPERFQHAGFRQFTIQPLDEAEIHEFID